MGFSVVFLSILPYFLLLFKVLSFTFDQPLVFFNPKPCHFNLDPLFSINID